MLPLLTLLLTFSPLASRAGAEDRPAEAYLATQEDIAAVQEGIAGVLKLAPELYPNGVENEDVILYDTNDLYVWTRGAYPLPKYGSWNGYTIYRVAHDATLTEREMGRCGGDARFVLEPLTVARREHFFLTCAPLGAMTAIQKKRGSIYDTRDSYLATIAHEYGHFYMAQELWQIPAVSALAALVKKMKTNTDKTRILEEAYAQWCELAAAKKLYPAHAERLLRDAHPGSQDPHDLGMDAVRELLAPPK